MWRLTGTTQHNWEGVEQQPQPGKHALEPARCFTPQSRGSQPLCQEKLLCLVQRATQPCNTIKPQDTFHLFHIQQTFCTRKGDGWGEMVGRPGPQSLTSLLLLFADMPAWLSGVLYIKGFIYLAYPILNILAHAQICPQRYPPILTDALTTSNLATLTTTTASWLKFLGKQESVLQPSPLADPHTITLSYTRNKIKKG